MKYIRTTLAWSLVLPLSLFCASAAQAAPAVSASPAASLQPSAQVVTEVEKRGEENWPAEDSFQLGRKLFASNQPEEGYKIMLKAAQAGHPIAQYLCGKCLFYGVGAAANAKEAYQWTLKSAQQHYPLGENGLGVCYETGLGVERNIAEALKWYNLAAEHKCARAMNNLGRCHLDGVGVPADPAKAIEWFGKAAELGSASFSTFSLRDFNLASSLTVLTANCSSTSGASASFT